ncbi:MAG: hypothetical protein WCX71_03565 [Candidatus Buchananbacteria bacterium]
MPESPFTELCPCCGHRLDPDARVDQCKGCGTIRIKKEVWDEHDEGWTTDYRYERKPREVMQHYCPSCGDALSDGRCYSCCDGD